MKKLLVILAMGAFFASCGSSETTEAVETKVEEATATLDSAAGAIVDSAKATIDSTAGAIVDSAKAKVEAATK